LKTVKFNGRSQTQPNSASVATVPRTYCHAYLICRSCVTHTQAISATMLSLTRARSTRHHGLAGAIKTKQRTMVWTDNRGQTKHMHKIDTKTV